MPTTRLTGAVRRNLGLLLVCALGLPAAALVFSLAQPERYTAEASLLFRESPADETSFGGTDIGTSEDPQRAADTSLELARLEVVAVRTAAALRAGLTAREVTEALEVSPQPESDLVALAGTLPDARLTARMVNTFAEQFVAFRREAVRTDIAGARAQIARRLAQLQPADAAGTQGQELRRRDQELEVIASLQTGNAELVQRASVPSAPSAPRTRRNVAVGLALGLILAVALVSLREQLNRRLFDEQDVIESLGLPILARVPGTRDPAARMAEPAERGAFAEALAGLRANVHRVDAGREHQSLLLVGADAGDGATTLAWHLAVEEARAGATVLLVEADLRRPNLASALGAVPRAGLNQVLAGMTRLGAAVETVAGVDVLFAGPAAPNPSALIESRALADLLRAARAGYERVIVDTSPLARAPDAIALAGAVGGVVLVVRPGRTDRGAAGRLSEQLASAGAQVLGVALNGVEAPRRRYAAGRPTAPASAVADP